MSRKPLSWREAGEQQDMAEVLDSRIHLVLKSALDLSSPSHNSASLPDLLLSVAILETAINKVLGLFPVDSVMRTRLLAALVGPSSNHGEETSLEDTSSTARNRGVVPDEKLLEDLDLTKKSEVWFGVSNHLTALTDQVSEVLSLCPDLSDDVDFDADFPPLPPPSPSSCPSLPDVPFVANADEEVINVLLSSSSAPSPSPQSSSSSSSSSSSLLLHSLYSFADRMGAPVFDGSSLQSEAFSLLRGLGVFCRALHERSAVAEQRLASLKADCLLSRARVEDELSREERTTTRGGKTHQSPATLLLAEQQLLQELHPPRQLHQRKQHDPQYPHQHQQASSSSISSSSSFASGRPTTGAQHPPFLCSYSSPGVLLPPRREHEGSQDRLPPRHQRDETGVSKTNSSSRGDGKSSSGANRKSVI